MKNRSMFESSKRYFTAMRWSGRGDGSVAAADAALTLLAAASTPAVTAKLVGFMAFLRLSAEII